MTKLERGGGNDTITIGAKSSDAPGPRSTFNGSLEMELGKGDDTLNFQNSAVTGKAEFEGGKGQDTVTIAGTRSGDVSFGTLEVKLGKGDDKLSITNTTVTQKRLSTADLGSTHSSMVAGIRWPVSKRNVLRLSVRNQRRTFISGYSQQMQRLADT